MDVDGVVKTLVLPIVAVVVPGASDDEVDEVVKTLVLPIVTVVVSGAVGVVFSPPPPPLINLISITYFILKYL